MGHYPYYMKGKIHTRDRCAVCGSRFVSLRCPNHPKVSPKRFYIDIYLPGKGQHKIYSDQDGQPLDSQERAEVLLGSIRQEIKLGDFNPEKYLRGDVQDLWACNLLDRFWAVKSREIRPSYQGNYRLMVNRAKKFFGTMHIKNIRKLTIIKYMETVKAGPKTVKNHLDHLKTFLNWCMTDLEVIDKLPPFPAIEVPEPEIKWIGREDQIKIFEALREGDRPIFSFMFLHGVRPGEARAAKIKDLNWEKRYITIHSTFSGSCLMERRKGRKAKPLYIPVHPELEAYYAARRLQGLPGAWLFPNPRTGGPYSVQALRKIWAKVKAATKIEIELYGATRHSFASQLLNDGEDLWRVSKLMGHSTTKMTERYAHPDIESLRVSATRMTLKRIEGQYSPEKEKAGNS